MTDEEWQSSWKSHIAISRAQLSEVLSRASGLDKAQLTEVIETFNELAKRYVTERTCRHGAIYDSMPPRCATCGKEMETP